MNMASDLENEDFFDEVNLPKVNFKGPDLAHHLDTAIGGEEEENDFPKEEISLEVGKTEIEDDYEEVEQINKTVNLGTKINQDTGSSDWSQEVSLRSTISPSGDTTMKELELQREKMVKRVKEDLKLLCKEEGVLLIPSWENHFISQLFRTGDVSKWEMLAWIKGIKHERATGTISELKEIISQLSIQVSRLTGQVKSLADHQEALKESDKVIYEHLEQMTRRVEELKTEGSATKQIREHVSGQPITNKLVKPSEIQEIKQANLGENVYTPHIKNYLITEFLKLLGVSQNQLNNELLRTIVMNKFPMDKIRLAVERGIKEDDKERIRDIIRKESAKLSYMPSSSNSVGK